MNHQDGNGEGMEPNVLTELFLRLWTEQFNQARRFIIDTLKQAKPDKRPSCEGALFMLDALREQYSQLPFGGLLRQRLEADCQIARHLLEQF